MIINTIDDLVHPQILQTATILAWNQVGLGICRRQDHEDLVQDLMLFLSKRFRRFTGKQPLVKWACKALRNHVDNINLRIFGIPRAKAKGKGAQGAVSVASESPTLTPKPVSMEPINPEQYPPTENQEHTVSANPISQPHAATNTATGLGQEKTSPSAKMEGVQRKQEPSGRGFEAKQTNAGSVRKLLHGFWAKLSSWVQAPQRDGAREPTDTHPKNRRNPALDEG